MHDKPIPSTGELLPVIGCGTWQGFDRAPGGAGFEQLPGVLTALFAAGGSLIDSSPMYGRAEAAVGEVLAPALAALPAGAQVKPFLATKVWTRGRDAGIAEMQRSMALMKTACIDLMQVHNLLDYKIHLATLRDWKAAGRVRYIGVTHYTASAYAELEAVLRSEPLDFVQLNYSIADRSAEQRLLPLAAERGVAVIANLPLGGRGLARTLGGHDLPGWAGELGASNWHQLLLKFVVSHPAITCAIPGTGTAAHMAANAMAGQGALPDAAQRDRLAAWWSQHLG
jgi:diketogulonate reductase-like aldo/keto reductase